MTDNEIIQEATEAVTKGLPCAFYVPLLLDVIKEQKASIDILGEANGKIAVAYQNAKSEAYGELAERAYKFLCNGRNWTTFKEQWLENGECIWLKENLSNLAEELTRNLHGTCTKK